jgi:hypothetical protein
MSRWQMPVPNLSADVQRDVLKLSSLELRIICPYIFLDDANEQDYFT